MGTFATRRRHVHSKILSSGNVSFCPENIRTELRLSFLTSKFLTSALTLQQQQILLHEAEIYLSEHALFQILLCVNCSRLDQEQGCLLTAELRNFFSVAVFFHLLFFFFFSLHIELLKLKFAS